MIGGVLPALLNIAPSKLYSESFVMIMRNLKMGLIDLNGLNKFLISLNAFR